MASHLMVIQSKFSSLTQKDLVPWMKILITMFAYFHSLFYLPATSFTTVWAVSMRMLFNNFLWLLILPSTFRLKQVDLPRIKTLKIMLSISLHSCGSSEIFHCSLSIPKMSLSIRKSILKRL